MSEKHDGYVCGECSSGLEIADESSEPGKWVIEHKCVGCGGTGSVYGLKGADGVETTGVTLVE